MSLSTVADLLDLFGPVPVVRIRTNPPPGTATEEDVIEIADREGRLCELVQGVLLEKAMGYYESYLAGLLIELLNGFVRKHALGIVAGEAGMLRLAPGLIRIPDVSFISRAQLLGARIKRSTAPELAPDLAIEVLSDGNTDREMTQKLDEYFGAGARLVWYVDPDAKTVSIYTSPHAVTVLHETETLDGGEVLPGFKLSLAEFFKQPDWLA
jgi:Uma2 family endonuclease